MAELKAKGHPDAIGVGAKKWTSIQAISEHVDLDWAMFANSLTLYTHPPEILVLSLGIRQAGLTASIPI